MNVRTMILAAALTPVLGVLTAEAQDPSNPTFRADTACINAGQDTSVTGAGGILNDTLQGQRGPSDTSAISPDTSVNRGNMPKDSMGVGRDSAAANCVSGPSSTSPGDANTGIDNQSGSQPGADTARGVPATPPSTGGMSGGTPTTSDTTVHNPVPDDNPRPTDPRPVPDPNTPAPPAPAPGGGQPGTPTPGMPR